jgi:dissimilatory sulfite reductase (desulfoviridin) alpha/beta subunit
MALYGRKKEEFERIEALRPDYAAKMAKARRVLDRLDEKLKAVTLRLDPGEKLSHEQLARAIKTAESIGAGAWLADLDIT